MAEIVESTITAVPTTVNVENLVTAAKFTSDTLKQQTFEKAQERCEVMAERVLSLAPNILAVDGVGATVKMDAIDAVSEVIGEASEYYFYIYVNGSQIKVSQDTEVDALALRTVVVNTWTEYVLAGDKVVYGTEVPEEETESETEPVTEEETSE